MSQPPLVPCVLVSLALLAATTPSARAAQCESEVAKYRRVGVFVDPPLVHRAAIQLRIDRVDRRIIFPTTVRKVEVLDQLGIATPARWDRAGYRVAQVDADLDSFVFDAFPAARTYLIAPWLPNRGTAKADYEDWKKRIRVRVDQERRAGSQAGRIHQLLNLIHPDTAFGGTPTYLPWASSTLNLIVWTNVDIAWYSPRAVLTALQKFRDRLKRRGEARIFFPGLNLKTLANFFGLRQLSLYTEAQATAIERVISRHTRLRNIRVETHEANPMLRGVRIVYWKN